MLPEHAALIAAAHALDAAFIRHINAGGDDQLVAACYADGAKVLPPNVPLVQRRGQIRELLREMFGAGVGNVVRETTSLHVAGDLAYAVGSYTLVMRHKGKELVSESGKHLLIYRRQAATWNVAVDMFSSDLPAG